MPPHALLVAAIFGLTVLGYVGLIAFASRPRERDEPQQREAEREPDELPLAA